MIYAGVDEAGYGPLLGPLCVGASAFRVAEGAAAMSARDGSPPKPPDLWTMLARGVCRKPTDRRRRVAVADSKKLKSAVRHPLVHLERGVLAFLGGGPVREDADYFGRVGTALHASRASPWHARPHSLPAALTDAEVRIARNLVAGAMAGATVPSR